MFTKILTDEQIKKIHEKSLQILSRVGVEVPHEETLSRFADSRADVNMKNKTVRIPPDLVMALVEQSGKQYTLFGRDVSLTADFGYGKRNYNSSGGEALCVDEAGSERRYATLKDVIKSVRFADALDNIQIPGAMADPNEIPIEWRCVAVLAEMIKNTTKPVTLWFYNRATAKYLVELMIALRGDEKKAAKYPLTNPFLEPISPLRFPFYGIDILYETSRLNLPVSVGPMAQLGLSAPATVAGTLALENAEILAGICISQLICPGVANCYGGICHAFDMKTTQLIFSGPEQAIFGVAMTQMGKFYGFPVYINVGLTDSKVPDAQAGLESGVTLMTGAAAGADTFGHMGISGVDQAASLDMLVMQNEVISYVESAMRQIDFSDEAFGLDVIEDVGPGGSFIDQIHTAEHFRKELWFPKLLDREYYQAWLDAGAKSMEQKCREEKERILSTHEPEPISSDLAAILDEIVTAAGYELGNIKDTAEYIDKILRT